MKRFEYRVIDLEPLSCERLLNKYGNDGWELVAVCFSNHSASGLCHHYFKRELPDVSVDRSPFTVP
jgi:hypothetical protein